jgi:exonuclease VII small subunit
MTNPLDEHIEAFQTAMNAIKIARRVLDQRPNPVSNTRLYGLTPQEGHELLDQAEEQLNKLVAFALFAAFERTLRNHLSDNLNPIGATSTTPIELASKLHKFLEDGVDNWRIDSVIELFMPPVADQDVNNTKNIKTYRNHVAHGDAPPNAIPPQTAYAQLSSFLKNAGLVT